jgi:hypothetical protein
MSDMTHSDFPVMGDSGIPDSVVNMSGQRSPYTQLQPQAGAVGGISIDGPTGAPRKQTEINAEVHGPLCKPQTTLFFPNAADHDKTGRNTKLVPSRAGVSDMWAARSEGPALK